eukprot:sb/3461642/
MDPRRSQSSSDMDPRRQSSASAISLASRFSNMYNRTRSTSYPHKLPFGITESFFIRRCAKFVPPSIDEDCVEENRYYTRQSFKGDVCVNCRGTRKSHPGKKANPADIPTNAFGELHFGNDNFSTLPYYIRLDVDTDKKLIAKLVVDKWAIPHPYLIISFIGGPDSSEFSLGAREMIKKSIPIIGLGAWALTTNNRALIECKKPGSGCFPADYEGEVCEFPRCENKAALERHHTHFILFDDGRMHNSSSEFMKARFNVELEISHYKRVRLVTLLVGGDEINLKEVRDRVSKGTLVVLIKGTGGITDVLCWSLDLVEAGELEELEDYLRKTYPGEDNLKTRNTILYILDKSTFLIQCRGVDSQIDEVILSGLRKISRDGMGEDGGTVWKVYDQLLLGLTWDAVENDDDWQVLKSYNFADCGNYSMTRLISQALQLNRVEFIRRAIHFKAYTKKMLTEEMFEEILNSTKTHSFLRRILSETKRWYKSMKKPIMMASYIQLDGKPATAEEEAPLDNDPIKYSFETFALTIDFLCDGIFNGWSTTNQVADYTGSDLFLSHDAVQDYLTREWMGLLDDDVQTFQILAALPFPLLARFRKVPNLRNQVTIDQEQTTVNIKRRRDRFMGKFSNVKVKYGHLGLLQKIWHFYHAPIVKFYFFLITYLLFLTTFAYALLMEHPIKSRTSNSELCVYTWVLSTIPLEIRQIYKTCPSRFYSKLKCYFKNQYNRYDVLCLIFVLLSITCRYFVPFFRTGINMIDMLHPRDLPPPPVEEAFYRVFFSIAFALSCVRLLQNMQIHSNVGPKVVMAASMVVDLLFFMGFLIMALICYGVSTESLINPTKGNMSGSFNSIFDVFWRPYINILGELDLDSLQQKLNIGYCKLAMIYNSTLDCTDARENYHCTKDPYCNYNRSEFCQAAVLCRGPHLSVLSRIKSMSGATRQSYSAVETSEINFIRPFEVCDIHRDGNLYDASSCDDDKPVGGGLHLHI